MEVPSQLSINLIVAIDNKGGISKKGKIPWSLKEDVTFFIDVTKRSPELNNIIIMGKHTWLSLPGPLKDRITIVVSTTLDSTTLDPHPDIHVVKSLTESINLSRTLAHNQIFICGGSQLYHEAINTIKFESVYLTKIKRDYDCDNFCKFPDAFFNKYWCRKNQFDLKDRNDNSNVNVSFLKYYSKDVDIKGESQYLKLLNKILKKGHIRQTRNAITKSVFGKSLTFDLSKGFPLLTTKKMFLRGIFEELMFFLRGETNAKLLDEKGVKIWNGNTSRHFLDSVGLDHYEEGCMGPIYGFNWRHFGAEYKGMDKDYQGQGFDQIEYCLNLIRNDPYSRRIIMTTFDPETARQCCLYPCHSLIIQWYVEENNQLSLACYNRSQDFFLGTPFNLTMSALLCHMFCHVLNSDGKSKFCPGRLIMNLGDTHIYEDHYEQCIRQILRDPYSFPHLTFTRHVSELTDFQFEDIKLIDYHSYSTIAAKMVV